MTKAHLVETYGPLRFTFGVGGSGASVTQQWVANSYPGIYDGLIVTASFADALTALMKADDCNVLLRYWGDPGQWAPGVAWGTPEQIGVSGEDAQSSCAVFSAAFGGAFTPSDETGELPANTAYDAESNPERRSRDAWTSRCRCSVAAPSRSGRRPSARPASASPTGNSTTSASSTGSTRFETERSPPLNSWTSTRRSAVTTSTTRGSGDALKAIPTRCHGLRSGLSNQANNLDSVPIIDLRTPSNTELHDTYQSWATRARLDRANGHHRNQVIRVGPPSTGFNFTGGDVSFEAQAFDLMDRWLSAVVADGSARSRPQKVIANKPENAVDRCTSGAGTPAPVSYRRPARRVSPRASRSPTTYSSAA